MTRAGDTSGAADHTVNRSIMSAVTNPGPGPSSSGTRLEMFDKFQPWVLATYGDSAKTKTITLKKAIRIQAGLITVWRHLNN